MNYQFFYSLPELAVQCRTDKHKSRAGCIHTTVRMASHKFTHFSPSKDRSRMCDDQA